MLSIILDFLFPTNLKEEITTYDLVNTAPSKDFGDIVSFFSYRDEVTKRLITELKYKGKRDNAKIIGSVIYEYLLEELGDRELYEDFVDPILIPIPLSRQRLRERGYNQTELIAECLTEICTLNTKSLKRIRNTESQTTKNKEERTLNLKDAFVIKNKELILNKNIILLDDVVTTGSTLNEAKETLLKNGAKNVLAIAVAH